MTKSISAARQEASSLGFPFIGYKRELRRVPGEPRNEVWYDIRLACPCGRTKRLWVSKASLGGFRYALIDHLKMDGLWENDHACTA